MKAIRHYMDEAIDRGIVKNDADLARQLKISRASVCAWRNGESAPNEDQAAAFAELLNKPEVLAECMAARAKNPANRAIWERAAKTLSAATASIALAVITVVAPAPSPVHAATSYDLHYVNYILGLWPCVCADEHETLG